MGETAWAAHSGLKHLLPARPIRRSFLGETAWDVRSGLKPEQLTAWLEVVCSWNGLGCPFGIETHLLYHSTLAFQMSEWPGLPVRD